MPWVWIEDITNIICLLFQYSIPNIMVKIANIYFIIYGYLLHEINTHSWRGNIQHYMLAHLVLVILLIYTYQQVRFLTYMLSDGVYIIRTLDWVWMEVLANNKFCLSTSKTLLHEQMIPRNIANIYVRIFGHYLHFERQMYRWKV